MTERHALCYVEVDIPRCILLYGETTDDGTCPAVLGVDSDVKCFNTLATCAVRASYLEDEVTLRFAMPADYLPSDIEAIPIITGIDFSPAVISLGEDLGQRASLTVNFKDIRWSDTGPGFDPYVSERDYNPFTQGTFWGKFRARQPYLRGRDIRVIRGLLGQALEDMEVRHYIIESFNGPTPDGAYSLIAKDVLKLADGDRAQAPALSNGFLAADIASGAGSLTLSPTGIGNEEYPASGVGAIGGKEIVTWTRSGDTVTLTARGQYGTTAQAHKAQDRFQMVLRYDAEGPADIIYDLLVNYAGVPSGYIDLDAWQTEASAFNARLYTATIAEPTSVETLVSELIEQAGLAVWWDDIDQKIRLQVLRQIATDAERFSEENAMKGTISIEEQPDRRLSQVWTYFGKINPLEGQEDPDNYRSTAITVDLDAETEYGSPAIRKIFSRWIPDGGRTIATRINDILLGRFRDPPRRFTFSVFRYGDETPTLGEGCVLNAWPLQDASGAREDVPIQLVRLNPTDTDFRVTADEMRFSATADDPSVRDIVFDANINGIRLITSHDSLYPATVGGETINAVVEEGAKIGAASTTGKAFTIEAADFPTVAFTGTRTSGSGVISGIANTSAFKVGMAISGAGFTGYPRITSIVPNTSITVDSNASASGSASLTLYTVIINLYLRGRIQGPGGRGGKGAYFANPTRVNAQNGQPGGTALYVRYPINLILDTGVAQLFGGGGGGGGAGVLALSNHAGGPGGGGAGIPGGLPGPVSSSGTSTSIAGATGTSEAGRSGGSSYASFAWSQYPYPTGVRGGNGGGPGLSGAGGANHGGNGAEQQVGSGGAAGPAIDGVSYVKKTGTGDIRGSEIN